MDICGDCGEEKSQWVTHQCEGRQIGLFAKPAKRQVDADGGFNPIRASRSRGKFEQGPLPPHVAGSDTSLAAAESMRVQAKTDRERVLSYIYRQSIDDGATADEVQEALGLTHQNGSARVSELAKMGLLEDSGVRRKTRSDRLAAVYVVTESGGMEASYLTTPPTVEAVSKAVFDRANKDLANTPGVTVQDVGFVRIDSPDEPSSEDFRDFHSMVDVFLRLERDETGGTPGPMTDRVMLWLKHLGES